ncbi:hemerythrin domain-containing protein [Thermocrispum municipale]|uniref:hemerythrin domain-containing protein n=1 Tax=Thermocrispum municipale TaxID=37926 RepID=UPI00048C2FF2|nr:hemerythrin domain-containing protein [Thermocrispum municipale]
MDERARLIAWRHELSSVHHRLRDAMQVVREALDDAADAVDVHADVARDLQVYCRAFCAALDGHHRGEAEALFPRLRRQRPELAEAINSLLQDHSMIDHLLGGLRKVLDSSDSTSADVTQHLDGISAVMETHFRYEEKVLAAALDELADPDLDLPTALGPLADVR